MNKHETVRFNSTGEVARANKVLREFPWQLVGFENEIGFRFAAGKTWTSGGAFGRAWSPMIELLSIRDLTSDATARHRFFQPQGSLDRREFRVWPEVGDPADVEYALVWKQEPGSLAALPNLRLVLALGAGVDQILADPAYPRAVPLARLTEGGGA